ncbi:hypothetical protein GOV12_00470 [Candidatus Pacearchaeota archaeon]|nr:hypothetical protein [Candidatus Pacearchaeota archaeon]
MTTQTTPQAQIYLYEENRPKRLYGLQILVNDEPVDVLHFNRTGDLKTDQESARAYGQALGKQLIKRGIRDYSFTIDKKSFGSGFVHTPVGYTPKIREALLDELYLTMINILRGE